ncbi:MAG TPA: phosphatase PAP2 family protein [Steroidobacteraceae bacterium]|nr:phosphatase PAP2 family protein [Steroidobacteraceae bacterium]
MRSVRTRFVLLHALAGAVLTVIGLAGFDRWTAIHLHQSGYEGLEWLLRGTEWLDTVTAKEISKFLLGLLVTGAALLLLIPAVTRRAARAVLFVGLAQLLGTLSTGVAKNLFGRLRPFELLQSGDWSHAWFVGGSSFPSGHAGFYFGLFLPLAWLFPRWRWPLMLVPWFIAVARIDANHHFVSDVGLSIAMVGAITLGLAQLARWPERSR